MAHPHGIDHLDEGNHAKRAKAWDLVQQQRDAADAEHQALEARAQEEAAAAEAARARPLDRRPAGHTHQPSGVPGIAAAAAGSLALGLKKALAQDPVDKRMGVMAAMQAEALARLEIAPHADQVLAEERTIARTDPIVVEDDHALTKVKNDDASRKGLDSAGRKAAPEALKKPTDRVAPTPKDAKPDPRPKKR